jgi:DNA polymerase-1
VIAAADRLQPERFRPIVAGAVERLRMNLKLTTLNLALPPPDSPHTMVKAADLYALLEKMEMKGALADARQRYGQPELF